MKSKGKYFYIYRSSVTGKWVSAKYAARHPAKTERERRVRTPSVRV